MLALKNTNLLKNKVFLAGDWVHASDGRLFDVTNPANGEKIIAVPHCSAIETDMAIEAAFIAQKAWAKESALKRAELLNKLYELMLEHQHDLAQILTLEQGKPLAEAMGEVAYGASYVRWFAEEARRIYGDVIPSLASTNRVVVLKQPVGVVAAITPWNFPNAMLARKIAPALAAGCSIVCKPANATPLSALALGEFIERAGFPKGLVSILVGDTNEIGVELTTHPMVRKVTFTGSTPVGKKLLMQCASTVKRTSMELGGNAPFIVFDDADVDAAVAAAVMSKYRNAGQTCVCADRFFIQEGVYDEFVGKFSAAVANLKVGDGFAKDTDIGPMINAQAASQMLKGVQAAVADGAQCVLGGHGLDAGDCFVAPTILTDVTPAMAVYHEENFGPVAPLMKFKTEEDVIAMANDTDVGLAAYFFTQHIGRVWRVSEALEFGMVGINEGIISNAAAPFGGIKESGTGREGSKYGLDDYTEMKYLCMGGI